MAVFTALSPEDAQRLAEAHGLGRADGVLPIAAGSVNSNFFLETPAGRYFARIYEEQEQDGVAYEWALLDHLRNRGIPAPARVAGPPPGELRVAGKPTAVFEVVGGSESCQRGVTPARAAAVGTVLARCHRAAADFAWRREGRFGLPDVRQRLDGLHVEGRPDLADATRRLREVLDPLEAAWPAHLPTGVIHGDLFRDNVRWEGDRIVALIDWESASDGLLVFDLMVCVLAWCYGDDFEWDLARAMVGAYAAARPLADGEPEALRLAGMAAAARFATTRITDFELGKPAVGQRTHKDYRRFMARLQVLERLSPEQLATRLL
jgi:homoserine kinase type II